jgi:peptide/nickel transport system substrate-binding protein
MLLMGFTFTLDPEISTLYSKSGSYNFMKYNNPKSDELLLKGQSEADPEKRKEIYHELQAIWEKDVPIISLYSDYDFVAISKQV